MVAATGAKVIAHHRAGGRIPGVDRGVKAGDVIKVGKTRRARSAWTRRATRCATSACARTPTSRRSSRATRCSTPAPATATTAATRTSCTRPSSTSSRKLPDDTQVYPGHDYIENNLRFTLAREPDNAAAAGAAAEVERRTIRRRSRVTTLGEEKQINTFLRLTSPSVIATLRESFPDLPEQPDAKTVFIKLRELRNKW